jgi:ABC-type branched-subunit amino acid transport system ATPase component
VSQPRAGEPILDVQGIVHAFDGLRAVNDVSFTVPTGQITSLIGPNGAGKTTIFNVICGLLEAQAGQIKFRGQNIENQKPHEIALCGIGRMFQAPRVFAEMSVLENVTVGIRQKSGENVLWAMLRGSGVILERRQAQERAEEMLRVVGLIDRRSEPAKNLSFGEQRFLSIARTLVANPPLLLMDEPTVGLDETALHKMLDFVTRVAVERGTTILLIEHHMEVVMSVSKKIVLLVQGSVVGTGTPDEIKKDRNMIEAYLGQQYVA